MYKRQGKIVILIITIVALLLIAAVGYYFADQYGLFNKEKATTVNAEKFMNVVRKSLSIEELTHTLLREMVEKIVVYECEYDENEVRRQRIDIYYSFVGKIDLPEE